MGNLSSSVGDANSPSKTREHPARDKTTIALMAVLVVIIIVVISLAGVVVYNMINGNNEVEQSSDSNPTQDSSLVSPTEEQLEANRLAKEKITQRAEEIYDNNPANTELVIDYYADLSSTAATDNLSYSYIMQAQGFMADRNLKEGELAVLERFDYSIYGGDLAYLFYARALELATELGDEAAIVKYQALAEEYKPYNDAAAAQIEESQEGAVLDETSME